MSWGSVADWAAVAAALAAAITAFLQWNATREQTRASLFDDKYRAYKAMKDHLKKALLNEGNIADVQAAQDAAHKLRFLFSNPLNDYADSVINTAWKLVNERQASADENGQRDGNNHYKEMASAVRDLDQALNSLDDRFAPELGHTTSKH